MFCLSYVRALTSDVSVINFTDEDRQLRFPGGGRMRFRAFLKRLYEEYENDAVADSAAALAYYFVFAAFPFLFFLATLTAFIPYIHRSVDTILARAGRIDVLANNAGISPSRATVAEMTLDLWRKVFSVNLEGPTDAHKITGDASTANLSPTVGYRFMF